MHVSGAGSQGAISGRRVYYPSMRWRVFAFIFPLILNETHQAGPALAT